MPLRIYCDQDSLNHAVVAGLRLATIDVLTAAEAGNERATDLQQLEFAASEGRVIYTANRGDFARIHREWMAGQRNHAGIITRSRQRLSVGDQLRGMMRFCAAFEPATAVNLFEYLERWIPPR